MSAVIPIRPPTFGHITNQEFLSQIFGPQHIYAHITAFPDPPDQLTGNRYAWAGGYLKNCRPDVVAAQNSYFVISLFAPDPDTQRAVRRKANFSATYVIVIDDIGEGPSAKVHPLRLKELGWPAEPSYRLETSPGNEQWGYLLTEGCTNRVLIETIQKALVSRHLCPDGKDPGFLGVTRYVRLPQGLNNKTVYHPAWKVRLNDWQPYRRFSVEDLAHRLGIDPLNVVLPVSSVTANMSGRVRDALGDWPADPVLDSLMELGLILDWKEPGAAHVLCPNRMLHTDREEDPALYYRKGAGGMGGGYRCHHGHCENLHSRRSLAGLLIKEYEAAGKMPPLKLVDLSRGVAEFGPSLLTGDVNALNLGPDERRYLVTEQDQAVTADSELVPRTVPELGHDVPQSTAEVVPSLPTVTELLAEVSGFSPTDAEHVGRAREIVQIVSRLPAAERAMFQRAFRASMGWTAATWNQTLAEVRGGGEGTVPAALSAMFEHYVYVARANQFIRRIDTEGISREAFRCRYFHLEEDIDALALSDGGVEKTDAIGFEPGEQSIYDRNGVRFFNIWTGLASVGIEGDVSRWLAHLEWLIPDQAVRDHLLNWMSFCLQYPSIKINHAILMYGMPGVGKDTLLAPISRALGRHSIDVGPAELESEFNDYLVRAKLVIFQEVDVAANSGKGSRVGNMLKPMIAAPPKELRVNPKGIKRFSIRNIVQGIFLTNEVGSLHVSPGDRRYHVIDIQEQVTDEDGEALPNVDVYFRDIWGWLNNGGCDHVIWYLMHRDVSTFDHGKSPPMTEAKRELINSSRTDLGCLIHEMYRSKLGPMKRDVVLAKELHEYIYADAQLRRYYDLERIPGVTAIGRELKKQFPEKLTHRGIRYRVVRNTAHWKTVTGLELEREAVRWKA